MSPRCAVAYFVSSARFISRAASLPIIARSLLAEVCALPVCHRDAQRRALRLQVRTLVSARLSLGIILLGEVISAREPETMRRGADATLGGVNARWKIALVGAFREPATGLDKPRYDAQARQHRPASFLAAWNTICGEILRIPTIAACLSFASGRRNEL